MECSLTTNDELIYIILNITNKGLSPSDSDACNIDLIARGQNFQVVRILKDMRELNVTHTTAVISNGYSIHLDRLNSREATEVLLVLSKTRDYQNKSYIINIKNNEFPHLSQRPQKNMDVDTSPIRVDNTFSVDQYSGNKALQYYIWMALITVGFLAILAFGVFYFVKICKRRENITADTHVQEYAKEEVRAIELPQAKDNL